MFKRKTDAAPAMPNVNDAVQQARTRARQRLIGAVVLLVIGVIGFPLVFESQPRPIPVDIPIDIPKKDGVAPLVMPADRSVAHAASGPLVDAAVGTAHEAAKDRADDTAAAQRESLAKPAAKPREEIITETQADAGREVSGAPGKPAASSSAFAKTVVKALPGAALASPSASSTVGTAAAQVKRATDTAPAPKVTADDASTAESARARALLDGKPVAAAESPRYVVQVGAFADADAAREVRLKVEKLGMKTYTQIAQTPSGSRIRVRVGPFASRDEADRALAKARAAGIAANVLTL